MKLFNFKNTVNSSFSFRGQTLESFHSKYQKIDIIDTLDMGIMMCLDDYIMVAQKDEYQYHELIVHPNCIKLKKFGQALIIGGGDGLCCEEVLKYPFNNIVQVEIDEMVSIISKKYFHEELNNTFESTRVSFLYQDALTFFPTLSKFEFICLDLNDPAEDFMHSHPLYQKKFYEMCMKSLIDDGVMVVQIGCPYLFTSHFTNNLSILKKLFPFVELYGQYMRCYGTYQYFASCSFIKDNMTIKDKNNKLKAMNIDGLKLYNPYYYNGLLKYNNEIIKLTQ